MDLTPEVIDKLLASADALRTLAWGELRPPAEYTLKGLRSPDYAAQFERVYLVLTIQPHRRAVHGHNLVLEGQEFVVQYALSYREMKMFRGDGLKFLVDKLKDMVAELAMELYELDPRIGHVPTEEALPLCPLFDPPRRPVPLVDGEPEGGRVKCPYCMKPFDYEKPPMWAGGNMGWAHVDCWTEGMQQLIRFDFSTMSRGHHSDTGDALRYALTGWDR